MGRGRHQSSCKDGKRTIQRIENIPAVIGVIIGHSFGGRSIGQGRAPGDLKLQRIIEGGIKAVLQTSKGVQEIFIRVETGSEQSVKDLIESKGISKSQSQ
jgi:hypothetical protein